MARRVKFWLHLCLLLEPPTQLRRPAMLDFETTKPDGIRLINQGSRITIVLDNPAVRNRLNSESVEWLRQLFIEISRCPEIQILIITGCGSCFSSGFDLTQLGNQSNDI